MRLRLVAIILLSLNISAAAAPLVQDQLINGATDFCFYVWSDTHFDGAYDGGLRDDAVNDMNRLAGTDATGEFGIIAPVAFTLHVGDITSNTKPETWENENEATDDDFMSCISRLEYPVFEVQGNHDAEGERTCVADGITERHGSPCYSFDYGGVHFVALGFKGTKLDFDWLEEDLAGVDEENPVILWQHFTLDDGEHWNRFVEILSGHNVALLIHGHTHDHKIYRWRGFDVLDAGHSDGRVDSWSKDPKVIGIVKIEGDTLRAVYYQTVEDQWDPVYSLEKKIER
jgi:predicted phosphodiesterase